jgi:putative heme-binding domain-containing protein
LPLTDGAIGPDGALYFLTGGRRLESDLYRVYYAGTESLADSKPTQITPENQLRRQIEGFHSNSNKENLKTIWTNLNHPDRHIRYASRVALEHLSLNDWKETAFQEKNPTTLTQAMIAMARNAESAEKSNMLKSLLSIDFDKQNESQQMDILRAYELVFSRMGNPEMAQNKQISNFLNSKYPSKSLELDRQFCKLLVFLNSPEVIDKTLNLIDKSTDTKPFEEIATNSEELILRNPAYGLDIAKMLAQTPPPQQIYLAMMLAKATTGWNEINRQKYFGWYKKAFSYKGGNSYVGFIDRARKMALANVPKEKKEFYDKLSGGESLSQSGNDIVLEDMPKGPGKNYKLVEMNHLFDVELTSRNFKKGKAYFTATTCSRCHAVRGEGSNIGPDLTQIGTRFSTKDMLEAILEPSKSISDQYASTEFQMKNGQSFVGKIMNQDVNFYYINQNPYDPDNITKIAKKNVISKQYSAVSSMLGGLINSLSEEELKDLLAYLKSGGDENSKYFK